MLQVRECDEAPGITAQEKGIEENIDMDGIIFICQFFMFIYSVVNLSTKENDAIETLLLVGVLVMSLISTISIYFV